MKHNAESEYRFYTYLDAINNTSVEAFGIPSVYYFGQWNGYFLMAITFLETELETKSMENGQLTDADVLIIFREFVSVSLTAGRKIN